jgi:eukaryotic-like serine/threonine-protein kinase
VTDKPEASGTRPQPAVPADASTTPTGSQAAGVNAPESGQAKAADGAEAGQPGVPADRAGPASGPEGSPAEAAAGLTDDIPNGRVLGGRYRLTELIAVGGMGQVWRGTDEILGRPVAVKLLSAKHLGDDQFRTRFRAEARYAASLSHPGIAQVYDYGESDQGEAAVAGLPYLVMELVEGEPLSAVIARDGRMPAGATLDMVAQAAHALAAAHAAGIVHRDIKPGNLLIKPDGQVKITDFGIARAALAAHLTQTGMVMGTAQYVSPEQASARPVTAAADIYSLGVVAYECLAGQPPFTAPTPIALALAHVRQQPPPLPADVPPGAAALIGQMLAKDPADRPTSAHAVAARASALKATPGDGADPWIIGSDELTGPATWFSDPTPTTPAADRAPTTHLPTPLPPPRPRRVVTRVLAAAAVIVAATAGILIALAAGRHPTAPASTKSTSTVHRAPPSRSSGPATGNGGGGSLAPQQTQGATQPPSPSPTTGSPSSSPTASTSPTPTTTPTESPSPSPTPTGGSPSPTPSDSPSNTDTGQPPLAGPQTPSTMTQDG